MRHQWRRALNPIAMSVRHPSIAVWNRDNPKVEKSVPRDLKYTEKKKVLTEEIPSIRQAWEWASMG